MRFPIIMAALAGLILTLVLSAQALGQSGTFLDDDGNIHEQAIETIAAEGITQGCSEQPPLYCPDQTVTRAEAAAFLLRAIDHGAVDHLPPHKGYFADVAPGQWYSPYVEHLFEHGITTGCQPGLFCPGGAVTRAELAAFLLRTLGHAGADHLPAYRGLFGDVPQDRWFARHVEHLRDHGITKGCNSEGTLYCPDQPVRRDEMASFLARTLGADSPAVHLLVGAGDIADCGEEEQATAALLRDAIQTHELVTVFAVGDLAYPDGTPEEFDLCYGGSWGVPEIKSRTRPVPGNHEYNTPGAAGYFAYWGPEAGEDGKGWYSYELGAWHVVALNSNCSEEGVGCEPGSEQYQWLLNDLAASQASCTAAYWHHPRFSSGDAHGSSLDVKPFWDALMDEGAEVVMVGHDHDYERFAPQDGDGLADPNGIRQFVVGTGGRSLRGFTTPVANSQVRIDTHFGVLELTLGLEGYEWRFLATPDGAVLDSGTGTCH